MAIDRAEFKSDNYTFYSVFDTLKELFETWLLYSIFK